jgi:hypothetical protein
VLGSLILLLLGINQIRGKKVWLAAGLGAILLTHATVYALINQSGGRTMQLVDWIPLVFYGIGVSSLISLLVEIIYSGFGGTWWSEVQVIPNQINNPSIRIRPYLGMGMGFLLLGLVYPLVDNVIPDRYSQESLVKTIQESNLFQSEDGAEIQPLLEKESEHVLLYGKMLYPRYFRAGERMVDHRWGTIPDFSYGRIEFYLVGTENSWIGLPSQSGEEILPHGSDVIVYGVRKDKQLNEQGIPISGKYIQAKNITILPRKLSEDPYLKISCSGVVCQE